MQSVLISPLVGAVFGVVLSGLSGSSGANAALATPVILIEKRTVIIRSPPPAGSTNSDPWAPIIGFVVAIAVVLWLYARFSHPVLRITLGTVLCCLAFVIAAAAVLIYHRYPRDTRWYAHIVAPFLGLIFAVYLVDLAQAGVAGNTTERADQLGIVPFFVGLPSDERVWIMLQLLGFCLLGGGAIFAIGGSLHFVAQLSLGGAQRLRGFWMVLLRATWFASGWFGVTCMVVFDVLAFATLSGWAYAWISP